MSVFSDAEAHRSCSRALTVDHSRLAEGEWVCFRFELDSSCSDTYGIKYVSCLYAQRVDGEVTLEGCPRLLLTSASSRHMADVIYSQSEEGKHASQAVS